MPLHLGTQDIVWRLLSALVGSALIGLNRGEHGHEVGMRTTSLVCLAACLSMIQANALLDLAGKGADSFVVMDLMRLPLGILSGIGFIGGGAILKKPNLVSGVTTAATLWFVTVIGLCLGGGQLALGWAGIAMSLFILSPLRKIEQRLPKAARGTLTVHIESGGPTEEELRRHVLATNAKIKSTKITFLKNENRIQVEWMLNLLIHPPQDTIPAVVKSLAVMNGLSFVEWGS